MASIHRKRGASGKVSPFWQAKFRSADGSTVWRSTKQTDSRKAIEVARKWEKAARLAANSELTQSASIRLLDELMEVTIGEHPDVQSVETYIEQWLRSKKATGTSSGTLSRYEPVLEGFLQSLSEKRRRTSVASITALEVERFRNSELEGGKTPGTANFAVKVLRAVFNTARRRGLCPSNPAEAVEMLPEKSQERLPFSKDQVKDLLAVAENGWRGMILLGYHTGIRLSDAANLTWANVDLLKRILVFRARKTAGRAKGGKKDSVVYMHLDLVTYFESLPASDDPNPPIFPNRISCRSLTGARSREASRSTARVLRCCDTRRR